MAVPSEIRQILREIKLVRSPVGRMKLLARAWKAFSRLKPWERKRIATRLGLQQFESILEGLSSREGGMVPDEIVDALDGIGEVEPAKVGEVVRQLRDPRRRRDLARRGLSKLTDHLAGAAPVAAGAGMAAAGAAAAGAAAVTPPTAEPVPVETPLPERAQPEEAPAEPELEPPPAPEPAAESPAPEEPPAEAIATTGLPEIPAPPEVTEPEPPPPEPPAEEAPTPPDPAAEVVERIAAEASLSLKFRLVRELLLDEDEISSTTVRQILAAFPEGWARRRILASMLDEGIPEPFEEALDLILELPSVIDRRWCAAALLRSRDITTEEEDRLGEAFPSRAMRRRIAHLAG